MAGDAAKVELPKNDAMCFVGKFDTERKIEVTINNPTATRMTFKFKLTAPKLIKLNPGYGYVDAKGKMSITITARPSKDGKPPSRDRIVVLLAPAPADAPPEASKLWKGPTAVKEARRQAYPLKFLEEAKKGKEKKEEKKEEKEGEEEKEEKEEGESSEESDAEESGD